MTLSVLLLSGTAYAVQSCKTEDPVEKPVDPTPKPEPKPEAKPKPKPRPEYDPGSEGDEDDPLLN